MKSLSHPSACFVARLSAVVSLLAAGAVTASAASGKAPDLPQVQAQLLDQAEFLCDNCFFGADYYYFCLAAGNKVLIAYQKVPVVNWWDKSKNYLTKTHPSWTEWAPPGGTLPIRYDAKYIWVDRPVVEPPHGPWPFKTFLKENKEVRLVEDYSHDLFSNNPRCREAVRAKAR